MSGIMDEVVVPIGIGVAGVAAVGIGVVGAVAGIAGAAVVGLVSGLFQDINEIRNIAAAEKAAYSQALAQYLDAAKAEESRQDNMITTLSTNVYVDGKPLSAEFLQRLKTRSIDEQTEVLSKLLSFQTATEHYKQLFFELSQEGIEIEEEAEFYKLKNEIVKQIDENDISGILKTLQKFNNFIVQVKNKILAIREQLKTKTIERTEEILFVIEHSIGDPMDILFRNEIAEILQQNRKALKPDPNCELADIKGQVYEIAEQIGGLEYIPDLDEVRKLLLSVKELAFDEEIGLDTKIKQLEHRRRALKDLYLKYKTKNADLFEKKRIYDDVYMQVVRAAEFLGKQTPEYNFREENAKEQTEVLKAQYAELLPSVQKKQKMDYIRKTIREKFQEQKYAFIGAEDMTINGQQFVREIYHIENGNVVSVTIGEKGNVTYRVSGVKMQGIAENKKSVVGTMKKFCSDMQKIQESMQSQGIETTSIKKLEPSEAIATEIELPSSVSLEKREIIRKGRLKNKVNSEQKRRYAE